MKAKINTVVIVGIIILVGTLLPVPLDSGIHNVASFAPGGTDKILHFGIFFILGISLSRVFYVRHVLLYAGILAMLYGLVTEVLQIYIPGRGYDNMDLLADVLGVAAGILAYRTYVVKSNGEEEVLFI